MYYGCSGRRHTAASDDVTFRWRDPEPPLPGDWYHVKVQQVDGGLARSSPVWVGAEPPR